MGSKSRSSKNLYYIISPSETQATPTSVDFSYYEEGMEIIHDLDVFDDDGIVRGITEIAVDEKVLKKLYTEFVYYYGTELFEKYNGMKILQKLDGGAFGDIFVVKYRNNEYTVKMEKMQKMNIYSSKKEFKRKILNEVNIQKELSDINYSIPILDYDIYKYKKYTISYILMEKMHEFQYTLENILQIKYLSNNFFDILYQKLKKLIKKLCKLNIIHGDMHWGNIYITVSPTDETSANISEWTSDEIHIGLIDFGFSILSKCNIEIELLALMKGIHHKKYPDRNFKKIKTMIQQLYNHFDLSHKYTENMIQINSRYNHLLQKYII